MPLQHAENLLRRYKNQVVTIKAISGGFYEGRVTEITNDFVELVEHRETQTEESPTRVFVFFQAMESIEVPNLPAGS